MGKLLKEILEKESRRRLVIKIVNGTSLNQKEAKELVTKIPSEKLEFSEGIYTGYGIEQLQRYVKYVFGGKENV
ncbi:hypothetical protein [uncultured Clostridium sp.]|uniref:hypothetical protein n=1 Tax=uncultured Clostridium sp. TaxID=59620 RepID=UPI00261CE593|nr:hypothetical protein [uncultured Clostridium sp.]